MSKILQDLSDTELNEYHRLFLSGMDYESVSSRAPMIQEFGFDVKFAYHVCRLILEVEQILTEGDLDLERNREQLKAIRRGEWTFEQVEEFFNTKEKQLEEVYNKSTLPYKPDEEKIKQLLLNVLEMHYGSLEKAVVVPDLEKKTLGEIRRLLDLAGY